MEVKIKLLREDGQTTIWFKPYKKDDEPGDEMKMTYDEWDATPKKKVEKNVWLLDIPETERDRRVKWLLEPRRMIPILQALAGTIDRSTVSMLNLGSILQDYEKEFQQPPLQFIQDARYAKQVFEALLK